MARTPIPVIGSTKLGVDAPIRESADAANGNSVANSDGQTVLLLGNTGTVDRTLAIRVSATIDGLPISSRIITVPAGQQLLAGCYPYWWYGMTLQIDPEHADLRISALRAGESIPVSATVGPFNLSGNAVVANLDYPGLTTAGNVLVVDTTLTSSTDGGAFLVVTV